MREPSLRSLSIQAFLFVRALDPWNFLPKSTRPLNSLSSFHGMVGTEKLDNGMFSLLSIDLIFSVFGSVLYVIWFFFRLSRFRVT